MNYRKISLLCLWLTFALSSWAQTSFSGYTVAEEGAWCWFADPRATHFRSADKRIDMSYLGYIDVHGNIKASQYNWKTGEKNDVLVRSYFQPDDHNNPTFLVLPDQRVLIIYSRHTDEPAFYYRISRKPGDITQLGEEKKIVTQHNTTYPSPFLLSDDPDHWYLCWRGIGWHPTIARLTLPDSEDNVQVNWGPYQMVQSTGARPYAKYYSNGKDRLFMAYTTGHPDNEMPNWLYFNVIHIHKDAEPTLEDIQGHTLKQISTGTFAVNKRAAYKEQYPYTVVDAPTDGVRNWVWQMALDKKGRPRIAMVKISPDKTQHTYYYAQWTGEQWKLSPLAEGGGKFHPSNTEHCYSGGEALDPEHPNTLYLSLPTEGAHGKVFEIWKYKLNRKGVPSYKKQITRNSEKNNVRPYVLPNSKGTPLRLAWMNGDYYYWMVKQGYPQGYPTRIVCDYRPKNTTRKDQTGWTLSQQLTLGEAIYNKVQQGTQPAGSTVLASWGTVAYGLNAQAYPYLQIGHQVYTSTNRLYTSDNWATQSKGTQGDNWPTPLAHLRLTLTYHEGTLTVYRNGLIDQVIENVVVERPQGAHDACWSQSRIQREVPSTPIVPLHPAPIQNPIPPHQPLVR